MNLDLDRLSPFASMESMKMTLDLSTFPQELLDHMRKIGRAEWAAVTPKTDEEHASDFRDSIQTTRENFGQTEERLPLSGVYIDGTETVICHTGTGPNSAETARILTGLWNSTLDAFSTAPASPPSSVGEEALAHAFRNVDAKDWDYLFANLLNDSGHGKFWKAVMHEVRSLLQEDAKR